MGTITKDFSYREFEKSDIADRKGICNVITSIDVRDSILALTENVLQPLRDAWGKPLAVNSGYRCPAVNAAAGGVKTSQHLKGEAADICPFGRNGTGDIGVVTKLARLAKSLGLPFDQMILYPTFVHLSHKPNGPQRGQILYNYRYLDAKGKKL